MELSIIALKNDSNVYHFIYWYYYLQNKIVSKYGNTTLSNSLPVVIIAEGIKY